MNIRHNEEKACTRKSSGAFRTSTEAPKKKAQVQGVGAGPMIEVDGSVRVVRGAVSTVDGICSGTARADDRAAKACCHACDRRARAGGREAGASSRRYENRIRSAIHCMSMDHCSSPKGLPECDARDHAVWRQRDRLTADSEKRYRKFSFRVPHSELPVHTKGGVSVCSAPPLVNLAVTRVPNLEPRVSDL